MPPGERSQTWYPEVVALLRSRWKPEMSWQAAIELRGLLQRELETLRASRGIQPPMFRCPRCGTRAPGAPPRISVRAMLLALGRFGIEPSETVRQRESAWARHRAEHGLDLLGRARALVTDDGHHH